MQLASQSLEISKLASLAGLDYIVSTCMPGPQASSARPILSMDAG